MASYGLPEDFKVGILNWQNYLNDELELMTAKMGIVYVNVKANDFGEETVKKVVAKCRTKGIHMVLSLREADNKTQMRVNAELGYPGTSDLSLLSCSSKYISRGLDLEPLWRVPVDPYAEKISEFEGMLAKVPSWPCILKNNLHTGCGYGVFCVKNPGDLLQKLLEIRSDRAFEDVMRRERDWFKDGVPLGAVSEEEVPFYHVEEMVRLGDGCVQYCIDGFVDENGKIGIWGIFEEMYTSTNMTFGYVTPPLNLTPAEAPVLEDYVRKFMAKLVAQGWKNQAFCAELWYRKDEGLIWMTEVNPRAAWPYVRSYRHTYGAHLIKLCTLVAAGKGSMVKESDSPWAMWVEGRGLKGPTLVTVVSPTRAGRIGDLLDHDHINDLRAKGRLVRHLQPPEKVIRQEDVSNAAGYWVLYVYYHAKTLKELAKTEREERKGFHTFPQLEFDYPSFWPVDAPEPDPHSILVPSDVVHIPPHYDH